jgi:hypothetical protein
MDNNPQHGRSQLFLVRLWEKSESDLQTDESRADFYGTVQHTVSGRTRNFKGWDGLNATLSEMLQALIHGKRR